VATAKTTAAERAAPKKPVAKKPAAKKPAAKKPAAKEASPLPKGATVDAYLAATPPAQRVALEALRKVIRSVAPKAEERMSYGICSFYLGRLLVGFGAGRSFCSFYLCSGTTIAAHAADVAGFEGTKSALHFTPDAPLPAALVKKLVKARLAENARIAAEKEGRAR
jgi:uncharacterized protein YdhG (YjbR/CyaY superfamily)